MANDETLREPKYTEHDGWMAYPSPDKRVTLGAQVVIYARSGRVGIMHEVLTLEGRILGRIHIQWNDDKVPFYSIYGAQGNAKADTHALNDAVSWLIEE
jgi:hypothetical protein